MDKKNASFSARSFACPRGFFCTFPLNEFIPANKMVHWFSLRVVCDWLSMVIVLSKDYFENRNYCFVLSSHDNSVLLAFAAVQNWHFFRLMLSKLSCMATWIKLIF